MNNSLTHTSFQKTLQKKNYQRSLEYLANTRKEADDIILHVWNEVEKTFSKLPEEERRIQAEKYGISYVYRKNELQKRAITENK
jgi:predicted deacetylase